MAASGARHTQAAADANHLSGVADAAGITHGADHAEQGGSDPAALLHLARGLPDRLDHQRNGALFTVEIGDGHG